VSLRRVQLLASGLLVLGLAGLLLWNDYYAAPDPPKEFSPQVEEALKSVVRDAQNAQPQFNWSQSSDPRLGGLGKVYLIIKPTGEVILPPGVTLDEASRYFWEHVQRMAPAFCAQPKASP
jgi:hypothetical protein